MRRASGLFNFVHLLGLILLYGAFNLSERKGTTIGNLAFVPLMAQGHQRLCATFFGLGVISLAEVRLQEGESIENALRRFKRKVQTEDIIKEVKRHSYYLKPGEKLRVKQALARKRARKKIRKEQD